MKSVIIKRSDNGNLFVVNEYDRHLVMTKLKQNKEYECKFSNSRNIKHLGKYWLLMQALAFHFGNTEEGWHLYYKAKFLSMIEFKFKNQMILYPSSIAFDKMTQLEFDEYYKKIETHLIEAGYNIDELIETSK